MPLVRPAWFFYVLALLLPVADARSANHALLIGISNYADPALVDLEGPRNDVKALTDTLVTHWGFDAANVKTLVDADATGAAMRESLQALELRSKAGDHVFIYFSGHASSVFDARFGSIAKRPDGGGTLVAHDFDPHASKSAHRSQALLVGERDLKPVLQNLDRDRSVWVVVDASFSGATVGGPVSAARGLLTRSPSVPNLKIGGSPSSASREIKLLSATTGNSSASSSEQQGTVQTTAFDGITFEPQQWKQYLNEDCADCATLQSADALGLRNVIFFGAAASNQVALDIRQSDIAAGLVTTHDGLAHGAFSEALLRVLNDPVIVAAAKHQKVPSYGEFFNLLKHRLTSFCSHCRQTPVSLPGLSTGNRQALNLRIFDATDPGLTDASSKQHGAQAPDARLPAAQLTGAGDSGSAPTGQITGGKLRVTLVRKTDSPAAAEIPAVMVQRLEGNSALELVSSNADVVLKMVDSGYLAESTEGRLFTQFDTLQTDDSILEWLDAQAALKARRLRDARLASGSLRVEFNDGLNAPDLRIGDPLTFYISSETSAALVVLLVDSAGDLSILYPASDKELNSVLQAGQLMRIPALGATPITAGPPFGTDQLVFYSLPPSSEVRNSIRELLLNPPLSLTDPSLEHFYTQVDSGAIAFGSAYIRVNTAP